MEISLMLKHIIYPYILRRHRYIGPWTRGGVIIHLFYITVILFCTSFTRNYTRRKSQGRALEILTKGSTIRVIFRVSRHLKIPAGQYLDIWMPTLTCPSIV